MLNFFYAAKLHLAACSHVTDPAMDVPGSNQVPDQVASRNSSAIRVEERQEEDNHIEAIAGQA